MSKAIDKAAGAEREQVGTKEVTRDLSRRGRTGDEAISPVPVTGAVVPITAPATPEAHQWSGWGTALKPAHEPVVVARKPLVGTVAANVLAFGTGAVNVDGCRVGYRSEADERESKEKNRHADFGSGPRENRVFGADERDRGASGNYDPPGRWPANVLLDPEAAALLDEQTGEMKDGTAVRRNVRGAKTSGFIGKQPDAPDLGYGGSGGASRFFYVAKASSRERNAGLEDRNVHPTVKPVELMRWLVRLVTPPGGTVLDPFAGSGTTGCACVLEGFDFIGVEREEEYVDLANARIAWWASQRDDQEVLF